MKKSTLLAISLVLVSIMATNIVEEADGVEVRGQVTDISVPSFAWNTLNFPGFYYDLDENVGNEQITFKLYEEEPTSAILDGNTDADGNYGITYTTTAQSKGFKFKPWGQYNAIGFLGEGYFAAYDNTVTQSMKDNKEPVAYLYDNSQDKNLMTNEQISKVLIDDNTEQTITSNNPLMLKEGYVLNLKSVDKSADTATLELTKDSKVVDTKIVAPSKRDATISDKTYYYKANIGAAKGIIQIAVHFKNAFYSSVDNLATVDGIFQLSKEPISIEPRQQYDKMSVLNVDSNAMTITIANKDYRVLLNKNKDIALMGNIHIKTANQNTISDSNPLRYYIYKMAAVEPETVDGGANSTDSLVPSSGKTSSEQKSSPATVNEGL